MLKKKLPHQPRPNDPWAQDMGWLTKRLRQTDPSPVLASRPAIPAQKHMRSVMEEPSKEQLERKTKEKENELGGNEGEGSQQMDVLSRKLEQLYLHYRQEEAHLQEMQSRIAQTANLRAENDNLDHEIRGIRNMLKEVLLTREKERVGKTG